MKRAAALDLVVLAACVAIVFGWAVRFPFVNFDDLSQIVGNPLVTSPLSARPIDLLLTPEHAYVVPVTGLSQAALWALGDGAPWTFHLANICLHFTFCAGLLLLLRGQSVWAARLCAVVMAVHPLVVEPVAWATGIKDLWSANFILLGTWLFVRGVGGWTRSEPPKRPWIWLSLAGLFAMLAVLAKPTALLIGWAWLAYLIVLATRPDPKPSKTAWRFAGIAALTGVAIGLVDRLSHDTNIADSTSAAATTSVGMVFQVLGRQATRLVWPISLHPRYYLELFPPTKDLHTIAGVLVLLAFGYLLYRVRSSPKTVLGLSVAVFTYLPVSNILPFPRHMADSYMYVPLAGLLVAAVPHLEPRLIRVPWFARLLLLTVIGALLGYRSHHQLDRWSSSIRLWEPTVAAFPTSAGAHGSLAAALALDGQFKRAAGEYESSFALSYERDFLNDFGVVLAQVGRIDEAECVMVEGAFHGNARLVALRNVAILVVGHPERTPVHEREILYLLFLASDAAESGKIQLDPRTRAILKALASNFESAPREPRWPRGSCRILVRRAR